MKTIILIIVIFFSIHAVYCQIVDSSCVTPDSIQAKYRADADRLTLRYVFSDSLHWTDSVTIPSTISSQFLNALIAIHNSANLPARDSVISIETFPYPEMNNIEVSAFSELFWMQELKLGNIPTGFAEIDSLLINYKFRIVNYFNWNDLLNYHTVSLQTDKNYNMQALSELFAQIPDVQYAYPGIVVGDGSYISGQIYSNHVELIYSLGWGDCLSGCIWRHYWKFNIYEDCSVEFVSSYGNPITAIKKIDNQRISLRPNPFDQSITIIGINKPFKYYISSVNGEKLVDGESFNLTINNLNYLAPGLYLLRIQSNNSIETFRIFKK